MPELPEVETIVRSLAPHVRGRRIASIIVRDRRLRRPVADDFEATLEGRVVGGIERVGKAMALDLGADQTLLVQLGMTGRLALQTADVPRRPHDHVLLGLDDGRRLVFNDARRFGWLRLVPTGNVASLVGGGVEPLAEGFTGPHLFAATRARRVAIKSLLMDQRIVLGLGNIYANEVLFHAGVRPRRRAARLTRRHCEQVVIATRNVLTEAIACGGSTISDYRDGFDRAGTYQARHRVYDRGGEPCVGCATPVKACRVTGRSTFYCPKCQA